MRIGPGKHLKGRKLMGGIVTPEEFDHFHEVRRRVHHTLIRRLNSRSFSSSSTTRLAASGHEAMSTASSQERSSAFPLS